MRLLQHLLHGFRPPVEAYVAPELVVVHMPGLTATEAAPLEQALDAVLAATPGSGSTGIDEEGPEVSLYLSTDDAVELTRGILPVLLQHPLSRRASITVVTRVISTPSQSESHRLSLSNPDAILARLQGIDNDRQHFLQYTVSRS